MLDCFGSMRVDSLTVDCPDGLQVHATLCLKAFLASMLGIVGDGQCMLYHTLLTLTSAWAAVVMGWTASAACASTT